jgi:hypothetical protein
MVEVEAVEPEGRRAAAGRPGTNKIGPGPAAWLVGADFP